ncbi:hypothetical protein BLA29_011687 [Euroglyphus maynei]|uniref:Uncharacterized protein n=1 Tax=Euroglyphus maynei TaxID=6958 RepID=A0A1Y3B0W0_EURMA|nr:hypothetical protein BLA29_011687 [Euroglyphus maynei]
MKINVLWSKVLPNNQPHCLVILMKKIVVPSISLHGVALIHVMIVGHEYGSIRMIMLIKHLAY